MRLVQKTSRSSGKFTLRAFALLPEHFIAVMLCCGSVLAQAPVPHAHPRKVLPSDPLSVDASSWIWVPILVLLIFASMLAMTRKLKFLGGKSLRQHLTRYVWIETLYNSMDGLDSHEVGEQRTAEIGMQAFTVLGCLLVILSKVFSTTDARPVFTVLTYAQLVTMLLVVVFDCAMIRAGYLRSVRSVNTKLRWAHSLYQVVLFCSDVIGESMELPVDCFIWATIHYSYESIGLALEGLNLVGLSMMAIIVAVNAEVFAADTASTGWECAFGLCSLALSVASMLVGVLWKWFDREKDVFPPVSHAEHH
jgi:hypothetical protein